MDLNYKISDENSRGIALEMLINILANTEASNYTMIRMLAKNEQECRDFTLVYDSKCREARERLTEYIFEEYGVVDQEEINSLADEGKTITVKREVRTGLKALLDLFNKK